MTCAGHTAVDGHPFHVAQSHDVTADCGMPGTHWNTQTNMCVADDDFLAAVETEVIGEWIHEPAR
jgi:hypothetical protein